MSAYPVIDVLIGTIGRPSLEQAILSVLQQTCTQVRLVVIADGPCPDARRIFERTSGDMGQVWFEELPKRLGCNGDGVKYYWMNHPKAGKWIKFLDDDDWLPPGAMQTFFNHLDDSVAAFLCQMATVFVRNGSIEKYIIIPGEMVPGKVGHGNMLVNTAKARGISYKVGPSSDFIFLQELAKRGTVKLIPLPLYWYNGWRSNAERVWGSA